MRRQGWSQGWRGHELKSQRARIGARVVDGTYAAMTARLQAENNQNRLVMR